MGDDGGGGDEPGCIWEGSLWYLLLAANGTGKTTECSMRGQKVAMDLHAQGTNDSVEIWAHGGVAWISTHVFSRWTYFLSAQVRTS